MTPLRIGVIRTTPLTTNCSLNAECRNRGFAMDTALIVCKYLGLNCNFTWYDEGNYGDVENGTATGMVGAIERDLYDTSLPVFTPTYDRFQAIHFSGVYSFNEVLVSTRAPREEQIRIWNIVYAFTWSLWFVFLWSFVLTASIFLISVKFLHNQQITVPGIWDDSYHTFRDMATSKHRHWTVEKFQSLRLLACVWSGCVFFFSSAYTSVLFSQRLIVGTNLPFTDLDALIGCLETGRCRLVAAPMRDSNLHLLTIPGTPLSDRLEAALRKNPIQYMPFEEIINATLNETGINLVSVWEERAYSYFIQNHQYCSLYTITAPYFDIGAFPLRKRSPLERVLTKMSYPFLENGLASAILGKYEDKRKSCTADDWKQYRLIRGGTNRKFGLKSMAASFYILIIGIGVSVLAFILEKRTHWKGERVKIEHSPMQTYEADK